MGNSKIPARSGGCCKKPHVPVVKVITAPIDPVDYSSLINKPMIGGVELIGDKTLAELGLFSYLGSASDIDNLFCY